MKKKIITCLMAMGLSLTACSAPIEQSSPLESSLESAALTSYEGVSKVYVYEVWMEKDVNRPTEARFDMPFVVRNGEPIIGTYEKQNELEIKLTPTSPTYGDGYYHVYGFYYDFDCTEKVGLSDIATKDLSLFYYRRG